MTHRRQEYGMDRKKPMPISMGLVSYVTIVLYTSEPIISSREAGNRSMTGISGMV